MVQEVLDEKEALSPQLAVERVSSEKWSDGEWICLVAMVVLVASVDEDRNSVSDKVGHRH